MWINRKEWRDLKAEVAELRRQHESHVVDVCNFIVYDPVALKQRRDFGDFYSPIPKQRIAVRTVVERILDKLGMELVYVEGQPARVNVQAKVKTPRD
jgi:hypothetical protein